MTQTKIQQIFESLSEATREGEVEWEASPSGFQGEISYNPALYTSVDDIHIRLTSSGKIRITHKRVIYKESMGSMGTGLYRMAKASMDFELDGPNEVASKLIDKLDS